MEFTGMPASRLEGRIALESKAGTESFRVLEDTAFMTVGMSKHAVPSVITLNSSSDRVCWSAPVLVSKAQLFVCIDLSIAGFCFEFGVLWITGGMSKHPVSEVITLISSSEPPSPLSSVELSEFDTVRCPNTKDWELAFLNGKGFSFGVLEGNTEGIAIKLEFELTLDDRDRPPL